MIKKLILLADRNCSTSRAYIQYLKFHEIEIEEIWFLNFGHKIGHTRKINFSFTNKLFSIFKKENLAIPYGLDAKLCNDLQNDLTSNGFDLFGPISTAKVAQKVVEIYAKDYHDEFLHDQMKENADCVFIYTNGGIVPQALLGQSRIKILHVHPGIVPDYKGSDCFFWSALETNALGYSVFYMSDKIDEGEILFTKKFPITRFPRLKEYLDGLELDTIYRSMLYVIDAHYRANTLIDFIQEHKTDFSNLPSIAINDDRPPFLWMHPVLLETVIRKVFT